MDQMWYYGSIMFPGESFGEGKQHTYRISASRKGERCDWHVRVLVVAIHC